MEEVSLQRNNNLGRDFSFGEGVISPYLKPSIYLPRLYKENLYYMYKYTFVKMNRYLFVKSNTENRSTTKWKDFIIFWHETENNKMT